MDEKLDYSYQKWRLMMSIIIKNLISSSQYGRLMISIGYIDINIYINLISHSRYGRLMIPICYIDIDIYMNLISRFRYGWLMTPIRFIDIDMNMNGKYKNELD